MSGDLRLQVLQEMISDKEVADVFHGTNFGAIRDHRQIIADTLLKIAGDYSTGHTAMRCCEELALLFKRKNNKAVLTKKGRRYLFWAYTS